MSYLRIIFRPLYWLAGKFFALWARPEIRPESPAELIAGSNAAVCYILESGGLADSAWPKFRGNLRNTGRLGD